MPLAIWQGDWQQHSIEVEVFGEFQPPGPRKNKLGKFKYRYRLFVDCECLAQEVRTGQIEDLVVLRGRIRQEDTFIGVRAVLNWDIEIQPLVDPRVNEVFGVPVFCAIRVGDGPLDLRQIGNTRPPRGDRIPTTQETEELSPEEPPVPPK